MLHQTLHDWELVAIDNGTGLGRAAIGPAGNDPRVRIVEIGENAGIARARNAGVAAARGEFVALLDYDDVAWPGRLAAQVAALRADPSLGVVGCHADCIDETGRRIGWQFTLATSREQQLFLRYTMPAIASGYTGHRRIFAQVPFRHEWDYAEDYDFLVRVSEQWRTVALTEPLLSYRQYGEQSTQTRFARQVLCGCCVRLLAARRRAGRPEVVEKLRLEMDAQLQQPPALAGIFAEFARRSNDEGFAELGVYHARKLISADARPRAVAVAVREVIRAIRGTPRAAPFLVHMFLRGPLRVHGLRPLGAPHAP